MHLQLRAFTHRRAWETLMQSSHEYALVIEQDSKLSNLTFFNKKHIVDLKYLMTNLKNLPRWDLLQLGRCLDICEMETKSKT